MALPPAVIGLVAAAALGTVVVLLLVNVTYILAALIAAIIIFFSISIAVLISQPFSGALIRLRANYLPKAVSLDNVLEDGQAAGADGGRGGATTRKISAYLLTQRRQSAKIGPEVSGLFAMLFRTKRLEGWAGVYKGSFPVACQMFLLACITGLFFNVDGYANAGAGGSYKSAPSGPGEFGFFGNLAFMTFSAIISLPVDVIASRAVVHPNVLPFGFKYLRQNLEELLSPAELAQPWKLYLIPGLLPVSLAHIAWVGFLTRLVRHLLIPTLGGLADSTPASPDQTDYSGPNSSMKEINPLALIIFLAWTLFSVVPLSPLEVIIVRLATQRPERQQPLHMHYSRLQQQQARANGPASYSHQATVPATTGANGGDKPLPTEPNKVNSNTAEQDEQPSRPSFAIEDEEGEDEATPDAAAAASASDPANADNQQQQQPQQQQYTPQSSQQGSSDTPRRSVHFAVDPPEPVIALRPVDENSSEEAESAAVQRYEGLRDCIDKIVDEEGVEALYRGAWLTALGSVMGGIAA